MAGDGGGAEGKAGMDLRAGEDGGGVGAVRLGSGEEGGGGGGDGGGESRGGVGGEEDEDEEGEGERGMGDLHGLILCGKF